MAKFLTTSGLSYHLEGLIKNTKSKLVLISPYLQFSDRIKEGLGNLYLLGRDIRIIYRENKLQIDESNWLEDKIGIRTLVHKDLHAKCYMNESEALITSMNLFKHSQDFNIEMGIHLTKENDLELYNSVKEEVDGILMTSRELKVTVKEVPKKSVQSNTAKAKIYSKSKLKATKELSKDTGISSQKINAWLVEQNLMYKDGDDWIATDKGKKRGGVGKSGQYGKFVVWPQEIESEIKESN